MNSDKLRKQMQLYAVTDRSWLNGRNLKDDVKKALDGGVTFVQLREKHLSYEDFYSEALVIKELCVKYKVPFVINDNVDIAVKINADGVHVGQEDLEAKDVRRLIGDDKIIGVSAQTVEQAILAEKNGADYLGVGAVFQTGSKNDAKVIDLQTLKAICNSVNIPVVAIGGITYENTDVLQGSGADGIAVISAIFAQDDIEYATKTLLAKTDKIFK
ncbi:MAG: thiamine phosphate synthase [Eubacteriales bacterium]|nr:thiamine phosphate synthase [Eubacteriales bacterium]MDY3332390.1 thiamine phosphate synthase [Gallibacter sp.]